MFSDRGVKMLVKCLQTCAHVLIDCPQNCAQTSFCSRSKLCPIMCRSRTKLCPNFGHSRARLCPISLAPCPFPNPAGTPSCDAWNFNRVVGRVYKTPSNYRTTRNPASAVQILMGRAAIAMRQHAPAVFIIRPAVCHLSMVGVVNNVTPSCVNTP